MELDDVSVVQLGTYCEGVLSHDTFNWLCQKWEADKINELFTSPASAKDQREQVYHEINGLRSFLQTLVSFVDRKREIVDPENELTTQDF